MSETKACPFCAETILAVAVVCKFCKSRLDEPPQPERKDPRRAAHEAAAKSKAHAILSGELPPSPPAPGPLSPSTWMSLILTIVVALPGVLVYVLSPQPDDTTGCLAVSLIIAGIPAIFLIVNFILDLTGPSPRKRSTPEEAVRAFYGAVKRRHYGRAWACLSPLDRTAEVRVTQEIPALSVDAKPYPFDRKGKFGKYWRSQAGLDDKGIGGYHKGLKYEIAGVDEIRPGVAAVRVRLRIGGYPSAVILAFLAIGLLVVILMYALRKEETFEVRKVVYERDGLWWMASGELGDGEDAALEELLRAS